MSESPPTPSGSAPAENPNNFSTRLKLFGQELIVPVVAILLAALIGAILIWLSGSNPVEAYGALIEGAVGSTRGLQRTLEKATPLIFGGLAVAFAFKAGLFNIGAQGQLIFGALAAAVVGYSVELPMLLHIPLALLVGGIAGALYGWIPGALRAYTGAHEVITTIMLNYIALNITDYLASQVLMDPTPGNIVARTPKILDTAVIPTINFLPFGFIIAILFAIITWWILYRTVLGYEIQTVGQNPSAAQYAGIKVARTIIVTMMISGFLAGVGGAVETQAVVYRFQPGFNVGLGFDGITIALLAKTNPFGVIPAALLFGAMRAGASTMQFEAGVATQIVDIIQALILFFVAADVIIRRMLRLKGSGKGFSFSANWGH
jgi:general nucleoside transport system permease protein